MEEPKSSKELDQAVATYTRAMQARIKELLPLVDKKAFEADEFEAFVAILDETKLDFEEVPIYAKMEEAVDTLRPFVFNYIKDINSAKMLLAVIFEAFAVDEDIKLGHDELKDQVFSEMLELERSVQSFVDMWGHYHDYRTDATIESKINYGADDLRVSLWILENQIILENHSMLLQMIMAYFSMMESIRETYEMLQLPGFIGRRKTAIQKLRNDLYS